MGQSNCQHNNHQWIAGDIQKETQDEMEASGLSWKQVEKAITTKARQWYLEQARK